MAVQPKAGSRLVALFGRKLRFVSAAKFWPAVFKRRLQTKIINETDKTVVLRAKYRDIWEGERVKLERKKSKMVPWKPEVYKRLGAFVETDVGQASGRPIYISNATMGENEEISITDFSSKDALQLKTKVKRSRKRTIATL